MEYTANQLKSKYYDDNALPLNENDKNFESLLNFYFADMYDNEYTSFSDPPEVKELYKDLESIIKEQKMYKRWNSFLEIHETWQTHREKTLELLNNCASSIVNVTEKSSMGKLILSSASILGSAAFLVTDYLNIKSDWQMKLLTASGIIGSVSFLCDTMSQYYSKSKVDKTIHVFLLDQDNFEAMNSDVQNKFVCDFIEKSFPFGINNGILKDILTSQVEVSAKLQFKIKEIERRYQSLKLQSHKKYKLIDHPRIIPIGDPKLQIKFNKYDNVSLQEIRKHLEIDEVSLQEMRKHLEMIELDKYVLDLLNKNATFNSGAKNNEAKIFTVIYLSNVSQKHELLHNTEFIKKTRIFSKSTFANLWWKKLENKKSAKQAEKKKLYVEMKSVLKIDKLFWPWPAMLMAILPLSSNYTSNALAIFATSSIIAFDAFCELTIKIQPKETGILKRLHRILSSEYEDLKLNKSCNKNQSD